MIITYDGFTAIKRKNSFTHVKKRKTGTAARAFPYSITFVGSLLLEAIYQYNVP